MKYEVREVVIESETPVQLVITLTPTEAQALWNEMPVREGWSTLASQLFVALRVIANRKS